MHGGRRERVGQRDGQLRVGRALVSARVDADGADQRLALPAGPGSRVPLAVRVRGAAVGASVSVAT